MPRHTSGAVARSSFTLIELLIVIAIVAVLAVVVVLTLNPAELLKQARDSNRLSDLQTLNKALSIYETDTLGTGSLGQASTTYFSLIDQTATTTSGTLCGGIPLTPPPGWTYRCAASSTYRSVNGTGWIPVNFSQVSSGSPISQLPVDPQNSSSSQYYAYTPGSSWALTSILESQKYLTSKARDDGGYNPGKYELGSNFALIPGAEGLVGWWDFEEGGGTTAQDRSGNANNGTWNGTGGHYTTGKVGSYAGQFNGSDDYVRKSGFQVGSTRRKTIALWAYATASGGRLVGMSADANNYKWQDFAYASFMFGDNGFYNERGSFSGMQTGQWNHLAIVVDIDQATSSRVRVYLNGTTLGVGYDNDTGNAFYDGSDSNLYVGALHLGQVPPIQGYYAGRFDDIRIYSRALSAAEIKAIYDATK